MRVSVLTFDESFPGLMENSAELRFGTCERRRHVLSVVDVGLFFKRPYQTSYPRDRRKCSKNQTRGEKSREAELDVALIRTSHRPLSLSIAQKSRSTVLTVLLALFLRVTKRLNKNVHADRDCN